MRARTWLIAILIIAGLFAVNYIAAWLQANGLAEGYYRDAEAAYAQGDYLNGLTGYKEYDATQNQYVQRGGFQQVERIWRHTNALPRPPLYEQARARIQEIITQHLTIPMAEQFVQANIGKANPYLPDIYLRLGELYEADGDRRSAIEVYREMADLFPYRSDLIDKANTRLTSLGVQP